MSREIKFRAWDEEKKTMVFPVQSWNTELFFFGFNSKGLECSRYVGKGAWKRLPVMQFTGLLDKNGKEIYEGDVVKYDTSEEINHWVAGETAIVVWVAPRFTFRMKPYNEFSGSNQNMPSADDAEFLERIGNIYENPELLAPKESLK